MTELIVALDGPDPYRLTRDLYKTGIRWFKLGPQTMMSGDWDKIVRRTRLSGTRLFLDLKLADTEDTVREAVRRAIDAGISAVSTYTNRATVSAMEGAAGKLRVWRVAQLTDALTPDLVDTPQPVILGHGVICPAAALRGQVLAAGVDAVCPGIRISGMDDSHGHKEIATPSAAKRVGATHIVVGRPIWKSDDPIAAARRFLDALA
jgi:orotidine-5'-phosphate decarboxylase